MTASIDEELRSVAARLRQVIREQDSDSLKVLLEAYHAAANRLERAWSGSNLGYHARVYYADFNPPPSGASFSLEWGSERAGFSAGTIGDWREFSREDLYEAVDRLTGGTKFDGAARTREAVTAAIDEARYEALSLFTTALKIGPDEYLESLKTKIEEMKPLSRMDGIRAQVGGGSMISRDMRAVQGGRESAVHQEIFADVASVRHAIKVAGDMATLIERAASHIGRQVARRSHVPLPALRKDRIFIGHGHSSDWRQLKDFLQDRLGLPWDEFNRVPVAGITNIARLTEMLDAAAFSLHILTAEDERVDGKMVARLNVVHEAGLFQGRLGFTRAIVMLEEGCDEFSNILASGRFVFPLGALKRRMRR